MSEPAFAACRQPSRDEIRRQRDEALVRLADAEAENVRLREQLQHEDQDLAEVLELDILEVLYG